MKSCNKLPGFECWICKVIYIICSCQHFPHVDTNEPHDYSYDFGGGGVERDCDRKAIKSYLIELCMYDLPKQYKQKDSLRKRISSLAIIQTSCCESQQQFILDFKLTLTLTLHYNNLIHTHTCINTKLNSKLTRNHINFHNQFCLPSSKRLNPLFFNLLISIVV